MVLSMDYGVSAAGNINMNSFEEGLGRTMYVAGALEYERPFMARLYRCSLSTHVAPRVEYLHCVLYLAPSGHADTAAEALQLREHTTSLDYGPRVDAQASADRTGIGGWLPVEDGSGKIDVRLSPWFSIELTKEQRPWVHEKADRPALLISSLEALAVLMALKLFYGDSSGLAWKRIVTQ